MRKKIKVIISGLIVLCLILGFVAGYGWHDAIRYNRQIFRETQADSHALVGYFDSFGSTDPSSQNDIKRYVIPVTVKNVSSHSVMLCEPLSAQTPDGVTYCENQNSIMFNGSDSGQEVNIDVLFDVNTVGLTQNQINDKMRQVQITMGYNNTSLSDPEFTFSVSYQQEAALKDSNALAGYIGGFETLGDPQNSEVKLYWAHVIVKNISLHSVYLCRQFSAQVPTGITYDENQDIDGNNATWPGQEINMDVYFRVNTAGLTQSQIDDKMKQIKITMAYKNTSVSDPEYTFVVAYEPSNTSTS